VLTLDPKPLPSSRQSRPRLSRGTRTRIRSLRWRFEVALEGPPRPARRRQPGERAIMRQPVLGLVWTVYCGALEWLVYYVGTGLVKLDPVDYLVTVPLPFLFGTIIVLIVLERSLFANIEEPLKGAVLAVSGHSSKNAA
jgi:hypothetical protein